MSYDDGSSDPLVRVAWVDEWIAQKKWSTAARIAKSLVSEIVNLPPETLASIDAATWQKLLRWARLSENELAEHFMGPRRDPLRDVYQDMIRQGSLRAAEAAARALRSRDTRPEDRAQGQAIAEAEQRRSAREAVEQGWPGAEQAAAYLAEEDVRNRSK